MSTPEEVVAELLTRPNPGRDRWELDLGASTIVNIPRHTAETYRIAMVRAIEVDRAKHNLNEMAEEARMKTFDETAAAQGWNQDSIIQILRQYIDSGRQGSLDEYAAEIAEEENA